MQVMSSTSTPTKMPMAARSNSPSPVRSIGSELSPFSKLRAGIQEDIRTSKVSPQAEATKIRAGSNSNASITSETESYVPQRTVQKRSSIDEDSSESDEAPRRPVGRIAARLRAAAGGSEDQTSDEGAYARIKRQLMNRTVSNPSEDAMETSFDVAKTSPTKVVEQPGTGSSLHSSPANNPESAARDVSLGLFVSPSQPAAASPIQDDDVGRSDSDSDALPSTLIGNERFQALVAKKRGERLAREQAAKEEAKESQKRAAEKLSKEVEQLGKILSEEVDDDEDRVTRNRLTQQSRPVRKASKKALEEMSRETQRLARNQQLTHQTMVKKKFTTQDLFKKFNYKQDEVALGQSASHTDDEYVMSGALISSDIEGKKAKETPPSSPPSIAGSQNKATSMSDPVNDPITEPEAQGGSDLDEDLPTLQEVMTQPALKVDKGKAPVKLQEVQMAETTKPKTNGQTKKYRIRSPRGNSKADDSDDEIEIVGKPRFAIFDKLPSKKSAESHSLLHLRALAHLTSPSKVAQKGRKSLTPSELQLQLQQKARKQALREKQERIAELRAKGIVIQTEEEKEKEQLEIENLLEKARQEAQELAKREKEAAKKEGQTSAESFEDSDDEEDGEYVASAEEELEEEVDVALSGSEEEAVDGDDENEEEEIDEDLVMDDDANPLIDNAATEDESKANGQHCTVSQEPSDEEENERVSNVSRTRPLNSRRCNVVVEDDEEEEEVSHAKQSPDQMKTPQPAQSSAAAAFGFKRPQSGGLGLTQMFAGTMADLDSQTEPSQALNVEQDSLALLREIPMATLPDPGNFAIEKTSNVLVHDSQDRSQQDSMPQPIDFGFSQFASQPPGTVSSAKFSEMPEPTQDAGFDLSRTPAVLTAAPHSTVETVVLPQEESPVIQRRGRLHRRTEASVVLTDDETTVAGDTDVGRDDDFYLSTTAFDVLFKAAKKLPPVDSFDKKKSEAKTMFEEQAEESEDEYAGLGGASDEDSDSELDEEVQKMMDDSHVNVNESKLAQLFADKERASDEKAIDKLYKDIATGALRRKRGANFDDLSEDEDDAAEERRRREQLEFAKMRKALLEDENIGKIAENPKKMAFLRAIEDRDEEDEMDFLGESDMLVDSVPDSQTGQDNTASQREDAAQAEESELQDHQQTNEPAVAKVDVSRMSHRRTTVDNSMSRPTTIAEIRESLSYLVEDTVIPDSQRIDSDSEEDEMEKDQPAQTRRRVLGSVRPSVVNRLSIVIRNDGEEKPDEPLAFHAPTSNTASVFKVPLLRRATNLSTTSSSSSGASTPMTETGVRIGGSKKSNIHYQAREAERRKIVEASERKRKEEVKKSVIGKGRSSVLGALKRSTGFE